MSHLLVTALIGCFIFSKVGAYRLTNENHFCEINHYETRIAKNMMLIRICQPCEEGYINPNPQDSVSCIRKDLVIGNAKTTDRNERNSTTSTPSATPETSVDAYTKTERQRLKTDDSEKPGEMTTSEQRRELVTTAPELSTPSQVTDASKENVNTNTGNVNATIIALGTVVGILGLSVVVMVIWFVLKKSPNKNCQKLSVKYKCGKPGNR